MFVLNLKWDLGNLFFFENNMVKSDSNASYNR